MQVSRCRQNTFPPEILTLVDPSIQNERKENALYLAVSNRDQHTDEAITEMVDILLCKWCVFIHSEYSS